MGPVSLMISAIVHMGPEGPMICKMFSNGAPAQAPMDEAADMMAVGMQGQSASSNTGGKQLTIISYSLTHAEGKVGIKTSPGQPEVIAPLMPGGKGFCVADFGMGDEVTECPNLLLAVEPQPQPKKKKKGKAKAKAKGKRKCKKTKVAGGKAQAVESDTGGSNGAEEEESGDDLPEAMESKGEEAPPEKSKGEEAPPKKKLKQDVLFYSSASQVHVLLPVLATDPSLTRPT